MSKRNKKEVGNAVETSKQSDNEARPYKSLKLEPEIEKKPPTKNLANSKKSKWEPERTIDAHGNKEKDAIIGIAQTNNQKDENDDWKLGGLIFMCNRATKPDCFRYMVMGLPENKRHIVMSIKPGQKLFLYDFEQKVLHGVYSALSAGGMWLEPSAFKGSFPAQVRFKVDANHVPLSYDVFKKAIEENCQGSMKYFKMELTGHQVKKLVEMFRSSPFVGLNAFTAAPLPLPLQPNPVPVAPQVKPMNVLQPFQPPPRIQLNVPSLAPGHQLVPPSVLPPPMAPIPAIRAPPHPHPQILHNPPFAPVQTGTVPVPMVPPSVLPPPMAPIPAIRAPPHPHPQILYNPPFAPVQTGTVPVPMGTGERRLQPAARASVDNLHGYIGGHNYPHGSVIDRYSVAPFGLDISRRRAEEAESGLMSETGRMHSTHAANAISEYNQRHQHSTHAANSQSEYNQRQQHFTHAANSLPEYNQRQPHSDVKVDPGSLPVSSRYTFAGPPVIYR